MRYPSPTRIESNLKKLNNPDFVRMSKNRNRRDSKKRGTGKTISALLKPTDPDKLFINVFKEMFKQSRRGFRFELWHETRKKKKNRTVEFYFQHESNLSFLPKKPLAEKFDRGQLNLLISDLTKTHTWHMQPGKYNTIEYAELQDVERRGKKYKVTTTFGFVPANKHYNFSSTKALLESMPTGYFILLEEKHEQIKGVDGGYRKAQTSLSIAPTLLWLKLMIDKSKARSERFAKLIGNVAPHVFPKNVPIKVVKLFDYRF
ncbi:MAG: hypothetical protein KA028_00780 [Candidatus Pacebacteria bacterium]|nr:hypothetical protein [Candidatus Paceibacterota bacterium]MBP9851871.1 hypothetical protein [Candidatus Paceibacterota bacterium]